MAFARQRTCILVDLLPHRAYMRGILEGAATYCKDHPDVELRHPGAEWELIGDPLAIDGVIAIIRDGETEAHARRFGKPVVNISSISSDLAVPTVMMDNRAVGVMAADHLLAQGYAHFAYHLESRVYFSQQRLEGFSERLARAHKACSVFDTAPAEGRERSPAELRAGTAAWLGGLGKPLGLFTHNDVRAAMLIDIAKEAGLKVPGEVGVIGCDNDDFVAETVRPTLSSVDLSANVVGYGAAELLVQLIRASAAPGPPRLIPPRQVVVRESTQPVRAGDELLDQALEFIRENAWRPISVDDVLASVAASRRSLERKFNEHLGRSPATEIRRVRMERARRLLLDTNHTLAWIGREAGYTNLRNFATAFRREQGMSPTAYRTQFRST